MEQSTADEPEVTPTDLTLFQQEMLYVLADSGSLYGLEIKGQLEQRYSSEVNHSRLYPNLDALAEMGLVSKRARDDRTNDYALTDSGRALLAQDAARRHGIIFGGERDV